MPSRKDLDEVSFDSLADRGQYRAFQRAYGKENQAMLTLIVLTVAWSYAAHVYGHGTVFVWFTRTLMTVLVCFALFQTLKFFHRNFEALVIRCGAKDAVQLVHSKSAEPKKRSNRTKNRSKPEPSEPAAKPAAEPAAKPAEKECKPLARLAPEKKKSNKTKTATQQIKTSSQIAAEKALQQAKTEADLAHGLFQQAKKAEAAALAAQQNKKELVPTADPVALELNDLPLPRPLGATGSPETKASYVPPHLREGYKGSASKPLLPRVKRNKKDSPTNTVLAAK